MKKKVKSTKSTKAPGADRVQIQFRLGSTLVARIDAAAQASRRTRNDWLKEACSMKLRGEGEPAAFRANEVSHKNRIPILFRIPSTLRDAIDKDWKQQGIKNRTMWIVEAILIKLNSY